MLCGQVETESGNGKRKRKAGTESWNGNRELKREMVVNAYILLLYAMVVGIQLNHEYVQAIIYELLTQG